MQFTSRRNLGDPNNDGGASRGYGDGSAAGGGSYDFSWISPFQGMAPGYGRGAGGPGAIQTPTGQFNAENWKARFQKAGGFNTIDISDINEMWPWERTSLGLPAYGDAATFYRPGHSINTHKGGPNMSDLSDGANGGYGGLVLADGNSGYSFDYSTKDPYTRASWVGLNYVQQGQHISDFAHGESLSPSQQALIDSGEYYVGSGAQIAKKGSGVQKWGYGMVGPGVTADIRQDAQLDEWGQFTAGQFGIDPKSFDAVAPQSPGLTGAEAKRSDGSYASMLASFNSDNYSSMLNAGDYSSTLDGFGSTYGGILGGAAESVGAPSKSTLKPVSYYGQTNKIQVGGVR